MNGSQQGLAMARDNDWNAATRMRTPNYTPPNGLDADTAAPTVELSHAPAAPADALDVYCREVRMHKLLTAEQEAELSVQMQEARDEIRSALFRLPVTAEYVSGLAARLSSGELPPRDVVAGQAADEESTAETRKQVFLEQARTLARLRRAAKNAKNADRSREKIGALLEQMSLADHAVAGIRYKLEEARQLAARARRTLRRAATRTGLTVEALLAVEDAPGLAAAIRSAGAVRTLSGRMVGKIAGETGEARRSLSEVETVVGVPATELAAVLDRIGKAEARFDAARTKFVEANLRLVLATARRYPPRGLSLGDLIQEGNIALMHAVEKFDHRYGCRFSTYAVPWIRQALARAVLRQGRIVRVTSYVKENVGRVRRATTELRDELDREPTDAEISERAGVAETRLADFRGLPPEASVSLDESLADDDNRTLLDLVEDNSLICPSEVAVEKDLDGRTLSALGALPEREREILRLRFGLGEAGDHNLEEIGEQFGVSRERVRQIEARALQRLRAIKR